MSAVLRVARAGAFFCIGLSWLASNAVILASLQHHGSMDWNNFWSAGATVGTKALLDVRAQAAWQLAHHVAHVSAKPFLYPPAVAWFYLPASLLPLPIAYAANIAVMACAAVTAAVIAARIYGFRTSTCVLLVLGWAPTTNAMLLGQQTPVALLLETIVIGALVAGREVVAGVAVGLLLYRPPDAVIFILLLAVRRSWKALCAVGATAAGWYLLSVPATGGQWSWPVSYVAALGNFARLDLAASSAHALSVPDLLVGFHLPEAAAVAAAILTIVAAIPMLARAPTLQAASVACLVGIAVSPHARSYDTVLALPALFFLMRSRTVAFDYFVALDYLVAPIWVFYDLLRFNPLAVVVVGETARALLGALLPAPRRVVPTTPLGPVPAPPET